MTIKPHKDKILVRIDPPATKTQSGLLLVQHDAIRRNPTGTVIATGPGRYTRKGVLIPPDVKPGDRVMLVSTISGQPMRVNGGMHTLVAPGEIMAVLEP